MERRSIEIARLFRDARMELFNEIYNILNRQDEKEMDLIESELRANIYVDDEVKSCELIGVSAGEDNDSTVIHAKYIDEDGEEVYIDVLLGVLNDEDMAELLAYMEDMTDNE